MKKKNEYPKTTLGKYGNPCIHRIIKKNNQGWRESPDTSGKAPDHVKAATKAKTKNVLRQSMVRESPEAIAARHIKNAPNIDWHRNYRIRSVRNISIPTENKIHNGRYILLEFTDPRQRPGYQGNFVGAYIINMPEIYMDEAHPVIFYEQDNDTWENKEPELYEKARKMVQHHIEHVRCSKCGSYRPPRITKRRGGSELIWITSTCKDCGHQEVEPFD